VIKILTNITHKKGILQIVLQDLPSLEDQLAEVERLIELTKSKLEEYLNE